MKTLQNLQKEKGSLKLPHVQFPEPVTANE